MFKTGVVFASLCLFSVASYGQTELYPTSAIIVDGSDVNFGFEGEWKPIDGLKVRERTPNYGLKITREGDGRSYLVGLIGSDTVGDSPALQ